MTDRDDDAAYLLARIDETEWREKRQWADECGLEGTPWPPVVEDTFAFKIIELRSESKRLGVVCLQHLPLLGWWYLAGLARTCRAQPKA